MDDRKIIGRLAGVRMVVVLLAACWVMGCEGEDPGLEGSVEDIGMDTNPGDEEIQEEDVEEEDVEEVEQDPAWEPAEGYDFVGGGEDRGIVVFSRTEGGFGEKPGGGPARLWDFGTEVFVDGEAVSFNAELEDGQDVEDSPLYGSESPRDDPVFESSGEWLRFAESRGHYYSPSESPNEAKSGAYFMGVAVTGGKTSSPAPFRDERYYYATRQIYPEGRQDNSLKTMRGSQRDSQQEGWSGSAAGNINKNGWSYKEDNVLIWPTPRENGYKVPVWSSPPAGDRRQWHMEEMLIDPTGESEAGRIFNMWNYWFADTGRQEWLPAMNVDPDGNEMGRWTPNEYWDETRGFYHQVGPEPAGYSQPDYYFGEVYVDDSWKRLYLGDGATWEETGRVESQRLITWEDESIEFALNLGALVEESELYLYWVDNQNEATLAGTLVRVGGE